MRRKFISAFLATMMLMMAVTPAFATDETLTIQRTSTGEYQAVINGMKNGCEEISVPSDIPFQTPSSISVNGNVISILSPLYIGFCGTQPPQAPYQTIANLGFLASATYQVNWYVDSASDPIRELSTQFTSSGSTAVGAPTLSQFGTFMLSMLIIGCVGRWRANVARQDSSSLVKE
jgi:hypothetical protein